MKNIFKAISGHSPTSCSQEWMDPMLNVWITLFFLAPINHFLGKIISTNKGLNPENIAITILEAETVTTTLTDHTYY